MEFEQMNIAFEILRERGTAFNPVATVEVLDTFHRSDLRTMDVAADHSVHIRLACYVDHALLEARDVAHSALGLEFKVRGDRPVAEPKATADPVEMQVELQDPVVESRANALEDSIEVH